MTKPEFVTGPSGERREQIYGNVAIVDVSSRSYTEQRAHEIGEAKMTESTRDRSGVMGGIRQLWKHNLSREYYRQVEISKARQRVPGWNETLTNASTPEQIAKEAAKAAVAERFANITADNQDTLLHKEAGERIHEDQGTVKESRVKKQLTNFVKDFAIGKFDEAEFNKRKGAFIEEAVKIDPKAMDGMEYFADNLLEVAKKIREQIETLANAGTAIENIDINLEVTLGRARLGARTETEFNRVDRVMEMVSRSPLRPFAGAISRALGAVSSVHGFVTGGFMGAHEQERIKNDRKLFERQRASGLTFDANIDRRRKELEETSFDKRSAQAMTDELMQLVQALQFDASAHNIAMAVDAWAEVDARVKTSDRLKVDLISYAQNVQDYDGRKPFEANAKRLAAIEKERTNLDLARAKLEATLVETLYNSGLTKDEIKAIIPAAHDNLAAWLASTTKAQESQFTHPEDGELVTKNRLAAKLGGYQWLWFRKPLGIAMTQNEVDIEAILARRPLPILPGPTSPVPGGEAPELPPEEPEVEITSIPDADIEPFFEVTGSLAEFKYKTGVEYTPAQVKALYGEYAKTGRFDLVADLRRGTGVALNQMEMKDLIAELDFAGRAGLMSAIPESAALIPWSESLRRIENLLAHGSSADQDPWRHEVAPMINELVALGLLDIEKPADGELVAKFFAEGFGMYNTPELMKTWINLKQTVNVADLPPAEIEKIVEWLGSEFETKTCGEVLDEIGDRFGEERLNLGNGQPFKAESSTLGHEIQAAFEGKRRDIINFPELISSILDIKTQLNSAENKSSAQIFEDIKPLILTDLNFEISRLVAVVGIDKKTETQLRGKIYSINQQIEQFKALTAPVDDQPGSIRKFIDELSKLDIRGSNFDELIATCYFKIYKTEHPEFYEKLKLTSDAIEIDSVSYEQLTTLTEAIVDKIAREDLPMNFDSGSSYYVLLRAFNAENPNENPLATANSRMDEIFGINSSRKKLPVGAMPEAETKKLLAFRAKHDLEAADEDITVIFSELLRTEITSRITDLESRRLIGLARLNQADAKSAFEAKDYVTAEQLAQKAIKLCRNISLNLGIIEAMSTQDRAYVKAGEDRIAEQKAKVEAARIAELEPIKNKAQEGLSRIATTIEKIGIGIQDLENGGVAVNALKDEIDNIKEQKETADGLFATEKYDEVNRGLTRLSDRTDKIYNNILRLRRENRIPERRTTTPEQDAEAAEKATKERLKKLADQRNEMANELKSRVRAGIDKIKDKLISLGINTTELETSLAVFEEKAVVNEDNTISTEAIEAQNQVIKLLNDSLTVLPTLTIDASLSSTRDQLMSEIKGIIDDNFGTDRGIDAPTPEELKHRVEEEKKKIKAQEKLNRIATTIEKISIGIKDLETGGIAINTLKDEADEINEQKETADGLFATEKYDEVNRGLTRLSDRTDKIYNNILRLRRENRIPERRTTTPEQDAEVTEKAAKERLMNLVDQRNKMANELKVKVRTGVKNIIKQLRLFNVDTSKLKNAHSSFEKLGVIDQDNTVSKKAIKAQDKFILELNGLISLLPTLTVDASLSGIRDQLMSEIKGIVDDNFGTDRGIDSLTPSELKQKSELEISKNKAQEGLNQIKEAIKNSNDDLKDFENSGVSILALKDDYTELSEREKSLNKLFLEGKYLEVNRLLKQLKIDIDRTNHVLLRLRKESGFRNQNNRNNRGGLLLGGVADTGPSTFGGGPATPRTTSATAPAPTSTTTAPGAGRTLRRPTATPATPTPEAIPVPAPAKTPEAAPVTPTVATAAPAARSLRRSAPTPVASPEIAPTPTLPAAAVAPVARSLRRPTVTPTAPAPEVAPVQQPAPVKTPEATPTVSTPVTRTLRRPVAATAPAAEATPATTGGEIKIEGEDEPFAKSSTEPPPAPPRRTLRR